jgi:hypothetical protein
LLLEGGIKPLNDTSTPCLDILELVLLFHIHAHLNTLVELRDMVCHKLHISVCFLFTFGID